MTRAEAEAPPPTHAVAIGLAAAAFALTVRVLYVMATPDARWPHSALFAGDAHIWLDYAAALRDGRLFELGLPLRPPGTGYLLALLWDGSPERVLHLRLAWALLGAASVGMLSASVSRMAGTVAGAATAVMAGTSSALLMLSATLDAEAPYLALVTGSMLLVDRPSAAAPSARSAAAWSALQALACLFRVEHALFVALAGAWWAWRHRRRPPPRTARLVLLAAAVFAAVLAPWHLHAWAAIERFNEVEPVRIGAEERALRQIDDSVRGMEWDEDAIAARDALPAFTRRNSAGAVAATVAWRGGRRVRAEDFVVLEDAFGSIPRPLAARPFVALYGPLNFALANHPAATGGFSRAALEESPPLAPAPSAFPRALVAGLPPPDLTLAYPPHLALVNDGYAVGARYLAAGPARLASLLLGKLQLFAAGAALGLTGYDFPLGASGLRMPVDLTIPPQSALGWMWRLALLVLAMLGAWRAPRPWPAPLVLWGLFVLSRLAVTMLFFGYARQGALLAAPLSMLGGIAAAHALRPMPVRRALGAVALAGLLAVAVEGARALRPPSISIDGAPVGPTEPTDEVFNRPQRVEVR